jgi:hypothetical protein
MAITAIFLARQVNHQNRLFLPGTGIIAKLEGLCDKVTYPNLALASTIAANGKSVIETFHSLRR